MRAGKTQRRDVPHEEGAWVEFRTLSGAELDEADDRMTEKFVERYGKETLLGLGQQSAGLTITQEMLDQQQQNKYDKETLIRYGVSGCSECDPCDEAAKGSFDAQTREWAVSVILEMNVRPLEKTTGSVKSSNGASSRGSSAALTESTPLES
jgi:hypothetical protein